MSCASTILWNLWIRIANNGSAISSPKTPRKWPQNSFYFFHSSFHPFKGPTSTWFGGHCWGQLEHGKQHCASDEPPYQAEWYGPGGADQRGPLNQQQYVKQQPDPAVEQQQQFDQQQHQQATWWNTDWAPCTGSFCINMCFLDGAKLNLHFRICFSFACLFVLIKICYK